MVYVMTMAKEGFAMGTMLGIERIIVVLAALLLLGNGLTLLPAWGLAGSVMTLVALLVMLGALAYYAGTGREELPDLRPFLKNLRN